MELSGCQTGIGTVGERRRVFRGVVRDGARLENGWESTQRNKFKTGPLCDQMAGERASPFSPAGTQMTLRNGNQGAFDEEPRKRKCSPSR